MQRGDDMDVEPRLQEPSDYNLKELASAKEKLALYQRMSLDEVEAFVSAELEEALEERKKNDQKKQELLERYTKMRIAVQAWQPPTARHTGLKEFMLEQLNKSISFDCSSYWPPIPEKVSSGEWRARKIEQVLKDIDYHTRGNLAEIELTEDGNNWIRALYASLPKEDK